MEGARSVEGLTWKKSSKSGNGGGECVELAFSSGGRVLGLVRDSKSPERGHIAVTPAMLGALLTDVKNGRLNMPTHLDAVLNDRLISDG
jgi:hypothetical protein